MAIDLLNIQPSVVARDLAGKYICIYGIPKSGKTSFAASAPNNLLLGFEHGWNALSGVRAVDINSWSDFKQAIAQLELDQVKQQYKTVTIDTIAIAWEYCEQYICMQNRVTKIGDIPWGAGYTACKKEFQSCIRRITQLGYGLIIIAHSDTRTEKTSDGSEIEILGPAIPKRCYDIVNQIVDIIGFIDVKFKEDGSSERWLYTRKTPTVMAGSRFQHLAPKIKFGYNELCDAIGNAIDKIGSDAVVDTSPLIDTNEKLDYEALLQEAAQLWSKIVTNPDGNVNETKLKTVKKIVHDIFGSDIKLSETTEEQVDLLNLVVLELRKMK